jgi:hypothetical protein
VILGWRGVPCRRALGSASIGPRGLAAEQRARCCAAVAVGACVRGAERSTAMGWVVGCLMVGWGWAVVG